MKHINTMIDTKKALKVKEALLTLSEYLDIEPEKLAKYICFCDADAKAKMIAASDKWNEFDDAPDFETRAKMLGIELVKH